MNPSFDPSLRGLNDCDCCEGLSLETPLPQHRNRPGLSTLAYRIGTHSRFKRAMLGRLSSSRFPALANLNTRQDDDFSVALIDAWATVLDVLSFYQERVANESYLGTATERLSLMHLGRLIGYTPRPGAAARAVLAFALEDAPGAPAATTISTRVKAQSIPEPGETPQVFETIETIEARPEWNAMRPLTMQAQTLSTAMTEAVLQGIDVQLRPGDTVLIAVSSSDRVLKRVARVTPDPATQTTHVELASILKTEIFDAPLAEMMFIVEEPAPMTFFTYYSDLSNSSVENEILSYSWNQNDLDAYMLTMEWAPEIAMAMVNAQLEYASKPVIPPTTPATGIFAMRQQAAVFGHNAPAYSTLPYDQRNTTYRYERKADGTYDWVKVDAPYPDNWDSSSRSLKNDAEGQNFVYLDAAYSEIIPNSWVVLLRASGNYSAYPVANVVEVSRSDFTLNAKVSRLMLGGDPTTVDSDLSKFTMRETTVLSQSEPLILAQVPISDAVSDNSITLNRLYLGLQPGQKVIVSGKPTNQTGILASEVAIIKTIDSMGGPTRLTFEQNLSHAYIRESVTVTANVASATHGETQSEVLGSGDASQPFQTFALRQKPLTYVSSTASETGVASTLEIRVNGVLWEEVPTLYGRGPDERIYTTLTDDDGRTTVRFGDGKTGQRLPTGQENVVATYRKGIGLEGQVKEGQISLLITRPHGVRSVVNPMAAYGADDREEASQIRENASVGIRTLGRVVSLQDYEDFARAYTGIAKALATWTWDGQRRGVFVTVAGPGGAAVPAETIGALLNAMHTYGDPLASVLVQSYTRRDFQIKARLQIHADYLAESVLSAAEAAVRAHFAFEARGFGQPVTASDVIAVLQGVAGVVAVDLDALFITGETAADNTVLAAPLPHAGMSQTAVSPATLLLLDPRPIDLGEMT